ncbi:hypothetical protein GCM10010266_71780 [Streptomyces griseomycini]|uniref:hypothetical protein n=1 Tax=Streptomyces griseomycini TaxID=66895 RepID=UPI001874B450|nr:hypothetical protein [Streptomyces griseomycini]GGQ38108.1 hypothetical protein GCM10010266_71780 [Streptomyces griseomycini]
MNDQVPAVIPALVFDRERVPMLVGGSVIAGRFRVGGASVVMGPAGMVIIAEASDAPARSGVWSAEEVRLIGPAPAPVTERLMEWGKEGSSPIHIAVRVGGEVLYLGTAWVSQAGTSDGVLTECELRFEAPLSRELLNRVRPPLSSARLPDLEWLRNVNDDRAAALEQFVTGWYPTADVTESLISGSASRLPAGLRQLYRLAKQRPGALGIQNRILPEPDLHTDHLGEMLVFGVENQGGFFWSLLWTHEEPEADPTVWFREFDEKPIAEQEPLSGFLIQFSLFEASMGADYLALPRKLTAPQVAKLTEALQFVPLRPFWPWAPTHFYVAPGLVVRVSSEDGEAFDVWAGATHRSALAPLADLPIDWNRFDG